MTLSLTSSTPTPPTSTQFKTGTPSGYPSPTSSKNSTYNAANKPNKNYTLQKQNSKEHS